MQGCFCFHVSLINRFVLLCIGLFLFSSDIALCQTTDFNPFADLEASLRGSSSSGSLSLKPLTGGTASESNPFADLEVSTLKPSNSGSRPFVARSKERARRTATFLKKETASQFTWEDGSNLPYSRQSIGGEVLQRFSDSVRTWGSFNVQGRLVHRENFQMPQNDAEGESRNQWFAEYHNLYLDMFNALDSFLSSEAGRKNIGRYNFRFGRFYLPSGINLQTDTHGTVLQLSNERNFGFERDWYAGFWGSINHDLNYDLYAMAGSGYDLRLEGQKGLLGLRVSLANRFLFDHGIEGGISVVNGERLSPHSLMRSPSVSARAEKGRFIDTSRYGLDARYSRPVTRGTLTTTGEWTSGRDEHDDVVTQLYQFEFLRSDRRLGLALQYRRFRQDFETGSMMMSEAEIPGSADASMIGEVTWYFRNDVGNSNLHWVKLNLEKQTEKQMGRKAILTTLQYYRYW